MNADNSHQTASAGKGALNEKFYFYLPFSNFTNISRFTYNSRSIKVENSMDAEREDHYNKNLSECSRYYYHFFL